ncbi:hypothetical protein RUM43_003382 [Polyplax serrata]|uniref:Ribosomal protein eL8/eL30/eS12/Gadd45 domain-containing protein n=1 Tax=Polyplax serrata TaxID=468196 RepID=A0AAN8NWL4_POLSC
MAAPVLTLSEQKKSLSAKKKKKVVRHVLGMPKSLKTQSMVITNEEQEKLAPILGRLLPAAKIPYQDQKSHDADNQKLEKSPEELEAIKVAKNNRSQLAIGVNDLNRSIKKNLIAVALLASDVSPKFLISHLHLLCTNNRIPYLEVPDLRQITQTCLGFPCIALGFRKESNHFNEAITNIQTVFELKSSTSQNECLASDNSNSDEEEEAQDNEDNISTSDKPFQFLYRTSSKERVFVPELHKKQGEIDKKSEGDFILLGKTDDVLIDNKSNKNTKLGISSNLVKKEEIKKKKLQLLNSSEMIDEQYEVPKKKSKLGWVLDKKGEKNNTKFCPTNIIKFQSNENRKKKKNK